MYYKLLLIFVFAGLLTFGCSSDDKADSARETDSDVSELTVATDIDLGGTPVTLAGVTFVPPTTWTDLGPSQMRKADYIYGPVGEETDSASVAVFYFGQSSGGAVTANIDRWVGQMSLEDGGDPDSRAVRKDFTIDGMPAHLVELSGTYGASMGGAMMGGKSTPKENYFMSAVVLEAPEGNVFFKLTGPETTAREMNSMFKSMLSAIRRGSES